MSSPPPDDPLKGLVEKLAQEGVNLYAFPNLWDRLNQHEKDNWRNWATRKILPLVEEVFVRRVNMREIATEEVMRITKEREAINRLNFADIIWTYQGKPIDVSQELLDEFEICGLNNMDFITSNIIPNRPWQD